MVAGARAGLAQRRTPRAVVPGGASNLTYLLSYPERDLILRRPPAGTKAASAHDMKREFTIQDRLRPVFPQVPEVLALCTDESVIGSEFYVMQRVPGVILRGDLPDGLNAVRRACPRPQRSHGGHLGRAARR